MKKTEIDYWIATMLESHSNVSDLNITVGKTLQVESAGQLVPVTVEPPVEELTPFQTEVFALNLIGNNRRLLKDLVETGSCDMSYSLGDKARFRVNIFTQKGYFSTVLRKLETQVPTIERPGQLGGALRERQGPQPRPICHSQNLHGSLAQAR